MTWKYKFWPILRVLKHGAILYNEAEVRPVNDKSQRMANAPT